ncbi:MAG: FimV/HubP family polar landmark protein [Chromatiaceae bacterium]
MFRKLILASAVSLALAPAGAGAMGLGGIRTQSALYEPFEGEIDLLGVKLDQLDTLKVGLAPDAEFAKVGAPLPHQVSRLRFKAQVSPEGRPVIRITSQAPIREPYLDFLVQVNSSEGRLVKEYTVLLDPPTTVKRSPPRVRQAVAGGPVAPAPARAQQAESPAPVSAPAPVTPNEDGYPLRYGPVQPGMGLWSVARSMSPPDATVAQTAMAIYRSNQDAFVRGNINLLKVGATLEIPTSAELFAMDAVQAQREFGAALQGRKVTAVPLASTAVVAQPSGDRLKIAEAASAAAEAAGGTSPAGASRSQPKLGSLKDELLLVREAGESTRQETDELRGRIRELETQLSDIRKLLKLRNQQLAQLQAVPQGESEVKVAEETGLLPAGVSDQSVPDTPSEPTPAPSEAITPEASDVPPEKVATTEPTEIDVKSPSAASAAAGEDPQVSSGTPSPEAPAEPEKPNEVAAATSTTSGAVDSNVTSEGPVTGPKLAQAIPPAAAAKVVEPARKTLDLRRVAANEDVDTAPFWESLPMPTMAVALGVPALLLPIGWFMMRRRRQLEEEYEASQLATVAVPRSAAPSASTLREPSYEGESEDQSATEESPYSAFSSLDDETGETDVASEADVYIAYGRYREAEYLLEEELSKAPERLDLKFKLAEAHFGAKNLEALTRIKEEIQVAGGDRLHEDQWRRLTSMVRDLQGDGADEATAGGGEPVEDLEAENVPTSSPSTAGEPLGDTPPTVAPDSKAPPATSDFLDLSLTSDRPTGPDRVEDKDVQSAGTELELELDDLAAFDLDLETVAKENQMAMARGGEVVVPRSEEGPLEAPSLDWPQASDAAEPESLDVAVADRETRETDVASSTQWQTDSTLWDEVSTKIDLARAYMDMADPEAARTILEEVAQEGNETQRAEATEMLARLA